MLAKPSTCSDCVLYKRYECQSFINPEGSGSLGVMIVGEAAGAMEALEGLPFRPSGDSGAVLERVFSRNGWSRDQFRITNILRCRPPNNKLVGEDYEVAAIASCRQYLDAEIKSFQPKAILALGGTAASALTGMKGPKQGIESIQGFPLKALDYDIPVVPALHPAFLRRGKMSWLGLLILHTQRAVAVARSGMLPRPEAHYIERATIEQLKQFRDDVRRNPDLLLAYDIETDYSLVNDENEVVGDGSNIVLVQFSLRPGTGIAIPWEAAAIPIIQDILAAPNPKVGHNSWMFDIPMLASHGVEVAGLTDDSMWAYHHLQPDLPRGLQAVVSAMYPEFGPWKHESGIDLNAYGCKDVDVLQTVWPKIQSELRSKGLWHGYERHVKQLWPILKRMAKHGIPIDREEQARFKAYLEEQIGVIDARLQAAYPEELKNVDPKLGFAKTPKSTEGLIQRVFQVPNKFKPLCKCVDAETGEIPRLTPKCPTCKGKGLLKAIVDRDNPTKPEVRWARLLPFKSSQDQLIRYMRWRKHKVPKAIGEDRETTSKLMIERMAKDYKDSFYTDNLELRGYQKQLGSYIWAVDEDGAVHPKFSFSPATGQLAASAPNVMTIPAPKGKKEAVLYQLATRFRKTIHARPGHALVACLDPSTRILTHDLDWTQIADLKVGDKLVGFDEEKTGAGKRPYRKLRIATVTATRLVTKPRLRITTTYGHVVCSTDHSWLSRYNGRARWRRSKDLRVGDSISVFTKPWDSRPTLEKAYLAGFLDGEGYVSGTIKGGRCGRVGAVGFGQNPGAVSTFVREELSNLGFQSIKQGNSSHKCENFSLQDGEPFTSFRLIGTIKPKRLLAKLQKHYPGMSTWGPNTKTATILGIEYIEDGEVIALETDTHTYIAEGLMSHNCDFSGFHANTFAFEAKDEGYFRLVNKIGDPHSFLTAVLLGKAKPDEMLGWDDEKLGAFLGGIKKEYKHIRDGQAKPAILGFALGLGGNKLFEQNRWDGEVGFKKKSEADALIEQLRGVFARGYRYQKEIRMEAHIRNYLKNPYGYIRWFFDVFHYDQKAGGLVPGDQAESAIAFNVQCDAHGMLKEAVLRMEAQGWLERYGLCNIVHDEVFFECPLPLVEELLANVVPELEKPSEVLKDPALCPNGLIVKAEPSIGWNRAEMKSPRAFLDGLAQRGQ